MSDNKLVAIVLIATIGLIGGGAIWAGRSSSPPEVAATAGVKAETPQVIHDWGEIPIEGGNVTAVFPVTNLGSDTLKLYGGTTSCACTTGQFKLGDKTSPLFGMHTRSASVFEVPPGETAELEVVFDPDFHGPNGLGSISRQATVQTNDPDRPQLLFSTTGNVVK